MRQTKIYIDDTPGLTPLALKAKARRLHARDMSRSQLKAKVKFLESVTGDTSTLFVPSPSGSTKIVLRSRSVVRPRGARETPAA